MIAARADDAQDATRLRTLLREARATGTARRVLLLRLSALPKLAAFDRDRAREALDPLLHADRAQLFALSAGDLAVVWRGEAARALADCLDRLGRLFAGLAVPDPDGMALLLRLPEDAHLLLGELAPPPRPPAAAAPGRPLLPATLEALEAALPQAGIERFLRRQPVVEDTEAGFRPAWERRFLAIDELFDTLVPGVGPQSDPWLLRRLGRGLDARLLAWLGRSDELRRAGPFGFELNAASLLSPAFLQFDAALPDALRGRVVVGLRPADIVADLPGFRFARDFARSRGYRLLLRAAGEHLALLPVGRLGLDLLQLTWSEALPEQAPPGLLPEPVRVVLGGADRLAAIAWGRRRGVAFFQGALAR